ncbi:MAG TPA: DUF3794 domain-containing protein [Halanaerobiaceae bacterium]|jgi:hypothetical protein|nr:DUF3794 domain-containing protein [Bacillota bacterium]HHU93174.1 DUF3794 domain-containing protein [Halanaerobiaceae bacterium]HOA40049.1 DUF3794 domain-containing protein [Halanaerobiales bacterium]HPZ62125.1 DUF3794 domain-containing protein [Halanaerobiales bacterium]HQD03378.1 DUF3794 domain-containing protein [Halanaerobiales bacterium]
MSGPQSGESLEIIEAPVVIGENVVQKMKVSSLSLDIPAIKIKDIDIFLQDIETEVIENKVIIQGIIHKEIFYLGHDQVFHHQAEDTQLSTFIDIPGAAAGMEVVLEPSIEHVSAKVLAEGKLIELSIIIQLFVKVLSRKELIVKTGTGPLVKVEKLIGENSVQAIIANDLDLTIKARKIVDIIAELKELEVEAIDDLVILQGVVYKEIYYIGEDELEHQASEEIPFSEFVDIPGTEPGMNVQAYWQFENIKDNLNTDGITINQKIALDVTVKVTETIQTNLVTGKDSLVMLPEVIGENTKQFLNESSLTLKEEAREINAIKATFLDISAEAVNEKVIVQGLIRKELSYYDKDNFEYVEEEEIPFCTLVNVVGARPGMQVDVIPSIYLLEPVLAADGKELSQKYIGEIFVKVTENIQFNLCEVETYQQ